MGRIDYHPTWNHFIDVTLDEIATVYGSSIYDRRCGKTWDVGQAVCAEQFGPDWMSDPEFHRLSSIPPEEPIPPSIVAAAKRLIEGTDWCDKIGANAPEDDDE